MLTLEFAPDGLLRRFSRDSRGVTAIIFGLSLIPLVMMGGLAIDYGRALAAKERLGRALDAAALAAASSPDLTEAEIEERVQFYFDANFPNGAEGKPSSITVVKADKLIQLSATGIVPTTLLQMAGISTMPVDAYSEVTYKQKHIELVMVLDNTGSMSWNGKIDALKSASNTLTGILFDQVNNSANGEIKIGLVPFAATVNVGADKLGSGWIDVNAQSAIASEDFQAGVNVLTLYNQITNRDWNGCVRARSSAYDTTDAAPDINLPNTLWAPYFAPDEPDFNAYANRYASDTGYSGSFYDYNARQRYVGKYNNLSVSGGSGPEFNCPTTPVTPLTSVRGTVESGINAMNAAGSTVIPAGLAWGWRVISPTPPYTQGVAYNDTNVIKAIVLLTDGTNDVGGGLSNHNRSYYNAYGFAQSGHLGATNGSQATTVLNNKTSTLCTNIKDEGVRLYTITFQLADGPIKDLMRDCATSVAMYFDSPSNEQLTTIFTEIAKDLSNLRISK
ncbi:MAG: TadE/TadG family type IV pilus assembly protein [Pseudomonadota bacterium]|nr:TadE/TadG family type IV pilus assembly protein [Pseudomonadota bacterium]